MPGRGDLNEAADLLRQGDTNGAALLGWAVDVVTGGSNSQAYRIARDDRAYLVKVPVADGRNRAVREAAALAALESAGIARVPRLVHLEASEETSSVIVQSWLEGTALERPPDSDAVWENLLSHLAQVHGVCEADRSETDLEVRAARDDVSDPAQALQGVRGLLDGIEIRDELRPTSRLVQGLMDGGLPAWPAPPRVLCRVDHFSRNYMQCAGGIGSVDWEYSGWGDPASDLAELASHPSYLAVPRSRWPWVIQRYSELTERREIDGRFRVCLVIRLAHWVVRCARAATGQPVNSDLKRMSQEGFREASRDRFRVYMAWATDTAESIL